MLNYLSLERYPIISKRQERANTLCKWVCDIPYYTLTSVVGYLLLRGMPNLPSYLGGQGLCKNNYEHLGHFDKEDWLV
jgi:hypothetical protein